MRSGGSRLLLLLFWGDFALCSPELLLTDFYEGNCGILSHHYKQCGRPVHRFFYNVITKKCERFIDFGCPSMFNRYNSMEQCQEYCEPKNVCQLPPNPGLCRGNRQRWFFDPKTKSCKSLIYRGCGGNNNNFERKCLCEQTCLQRGSP